MPTQPSKLKCLQEWHSWNHVCVCVRRRGVLCPVCTSRITLIIDTIIRQHTLVGFCLAHEGWNSLRSETMPQNACCLIECNKLQVNNYSSLSLPRRKSVVRDHIHTHPSLTTHMRSRSATTWPINTNNHESFTRRLRINSVRGFVCIRLSVRDGSEWTQCKGIWINGWTGVIR